MLVDFRNDFKKHLNDDLLQNKPNFQSLRNLTSTLNNKTKIAFKNNEFDIFSGNKTNSKLNFKAQCNKNKNRTQSFQLFKPKRHAKHQKISRKVEKCHQKNRETLKILRKPRIFKKTCPRNISTPAKPRNSETFNKTNHNTTISTEIDLGVDSIFKVLIKHIKELKTNQMIWQEVISNQEEFNAKILSVSELLDAKTLTLMEANENLTIQLNSAREKNKELTEKLGNMTVLIRNLQEKMHEESEFFIWKVLIISMLSSVCFLIVGLFLYCLSDMPTRKKDQNYLEKKTKEPQRKRSYSAEKEMTSSRSKKNSKRKRKSEAKEQRSSSVTSDKEEIKNLRKIRCSPRNLSQFFQARKPLNN